MTTIFSALEWTQQDREWAQDDGWDIFELDGTGGLEIQAVTEAGKFKNDEEARRFVATHPCDLTYKALAVIAKAVIEPSMPTDNIAGAISRYEDQYQHGIDEVPVPLPVVAVLTMLRCTV